VGQLVVCSGERGRTLQQLVAFMLAHLVGNAAEEFDTQTNEVVEDGPSGLGQLQKRRTPIVWRHAAGDEPGVSEPVTESAGTGRHKVEIIAQLGNQTGTHPLQGLQRAQPGEPDALFNLLEDHDVQCQESTCRLLQFGGVAMAWPRAVKGA
jgi:hypothetical protein